MKIGITTTIKYNKMANVYAINDFYIKIVEDLGHLPIMLPFLEKDEYIDGILDRLDLLILSGGDDISPFSYGEDPKPETLNFSFDRDAFEFKIAKKAFEKKIPTLAICRGLQLVNVLFGGSLHQDLKYFKTENPIVHRNDDENNAENFHYLDVKSGSRLARALEIYEDKTIVVNSIHHQGIDRLGNYLKPVAYSKDGLIEAFERDDWKMIAVQFHPEMMTKLNTKNLIKVLLEEE